MLLLVALSCTGEGPDLAAVSDANLRPAGSPDVLLVTVAGHCTNCASEYNGEYLQSWGVPASIEGVIEDEGLSVETWTYVDELYSWTRGSEVLVYGYLALVQDLEWVEENWIADFDNPTRIVLLGHSHGVVWAHSAAMDADHVPIDVLVDMDGVCMNWEDDDWAFGFGDDWNQEVDAYEQRNGRLSWFDLSNPCDSWDLGTGEYMNIDDVVSWNVGVNLEVRSSDWLLFDSQDNLRYDGTSDTSIYVSDLSHMNILDPGEDAMAWVRGRLRSGLVSVPR
jgi:hypothetical protein